MKKSYFFFSFMCLFIGFQNKTTLAQHSDTTNTMIEIVVNALNNSDLSVLEPHLDDNFTIAGQKGEIAKIVLKQLFLQLNETILSYDKIREESINQNQVLVYKVNYQKMGEKESILTITPEGKLLELVLFEMEVKKLDKQASLTKSDRPVITVPFEQVSKLIIVKAMINGKRRNFLVDSGAPKLILNANYFANDDPNKKVISQSKGVGGSITKVDLTTIEEFNWEGLQIKNQDVLTVDLAHLESELEVEIYGLIGYELLKEYDVLFDYKRKHLKLILPEKWDNYYNKYFRDDKLITIPFELKAHLPVVEATIGNATYRLGIDSGAEANLLDVKYFSQLKKKKRLKRVKKDVLMGADNQAQTVNRGKIKKLKLGAKTIKRTRTAFSDLSHLNDGYQLDLDGLVGYEILRKQPTILCFSTNQLIFVQ